MLRRNGAGPEETVMMMVMSVFEHQQVVSEKLTLLINTRLDRIARILKVCMNRVHIFYCIRTTAIIFSAHVICKIDYCFLGSRFIT